MAIISKYGRNFDAGWKNADGYFAYDDLGIEMWNIQQGDEYLKSQGRSLAFHYENCRKILWPKLDAHRWHTLCRDEVLSHKVCVLLGCGSSGKTHEAAWISLLDYWCHPNDTCILVSSTDVRGLKKRIWGEIAMLWEQGVEKFPKLSGHLLDSAIAITTDDIEDCDPGARKSRDMRKGIFGVPTVQGGKFLGLQKFVGIKQKRMRLVADEACFPLGTLVDTPTGKRRIEEIKSGDLVINAMGFSKVKRAMKFMRSSLVRIKTKDGREIVCTPNHPFFTNLGWKKALELNQTCYMMSPYESMQIMRGEIPTDNKRQTLCCVSGSSNEIELQRLRKGIQKETSKQQANVLQSILRSEMEFNATRIPEKILYRNSSQEDRGSVRFETQKPTGVACEIHKGCYWEKSPHEESRNKEENYCHSKTHRTPTKAKGRQWDRANTSGEIVAQILPASQQQLSHQNRNEGGKRIPNPLQSRFGISEFEIGSRGRWKFSHDEHEEKTGHQENKISEGSWVDGVALLEQADFERYGGSDKGVAVYNLEVENHPSFSVNGLLSHNSMMGESFLSAFANLNKNEDFRAIILGNPNDPLDPLGRAAEPKEGWTDEYMEPTKTKVWDTRFMNGRCVNLIGLDSPNFDFPPEKPTKFKYLISKEKIDDTLSFFQKDSIEYYSQCVGSMKIGTMARRVISRHLCQQFGALDDVVWHGEKPMRICGLDAAYGGDRCVCGYIEFGPSVSGQIIFRFTPPVVVPIKVNASVIPEDQIAAFVRDFCRENEIPPENFFHDSTGRGTLGTAIARLWSDKCNPVEFGGNATDRPVSKDLYITDEKTGQRRLKRCDEHYSNFVAELWYSVRYAIESNSVRNLPQDVMEEMSMREWDWIKGQKKIALETKVDMKLRVGRSPDLGDWAAICMEGARRRGFQIPKLGLADTAKRPKVDDWFIKQYEKTQALNKSRQLQSA